MTTDQNDYLKNWLFRANSAPLSESDIKSFARKYNTHPAIIIGRLQHDKLISYGLGRQFFKPVDFN